MRAVESALIALLLAALAAGVALVPLTTSWMTRSLAVRYSQLPPEEAVPLAEAARKYVVSGDADARRMLEASLAPDAVPHLDDVERVISGARLATAGIAFVLVIWFVWRGRRELGLVARALGIAGLVLLAATTLVGVVALTDFDTFFSAFHALFFAPGTWTFPSDSVLIRLVPEAFWAAEAAIWGVLVVLVGGVYVVSAALLRRRVSRREGA